MRIAIEGQRLFRKNKHGMDFVALELIRNLMKIDHVNEYFIFVASGEDRCLTDTTNFKIIELKAQAYPIWEQIALPKAVRKYNCDILHCTSNTAPLFSPVPLVLTLHDIIYLERNNLFNSNATLYQKLGNIYRKMIVPSVVKQSSKVITVSKFEKATIKRHFGIHKDDEKFDFVYNGVSSHFKKVTDKDVLARVKNKYKLPDHFFFHLGNSDPKKNTVGVVKAYSEFIKKTNSEIYLVMPDFDEKHLESILKEVNHPTLRDRIILTGYIVNSDLPSIYTLCDIFLYPSLRESFGIPLLEAMSCGALVVTSNTSSMPEIVGDAAIKINPYDIKEITNAMISLESRPRFTDTLRLEGMTKAAKFSWERMAQTILVYYIEIAMKNKLVIDAKVSA